MPRFTIRGATGVAVYVAVNKDVITVGSAADNDLVVPNPLVSPRHAEISREGDDWLVADLASRHGTLLNGQRVTHPAGIKPGDEIGLGTAVVLVDGPEGAASARLAEHRCAIVAPAIVVPEALDASEAAEPRLVGDSPPMLALLEMIDRLAASTATALIRGESGTGKEIVARLIHHRSRRSSRPFVVVNCPALPGSLIEYELFGVGKRVATGVDARAGLLELANGGTLLLDEVGDLDPIAQAKLLRFVQDKKIERIGGRKLIPLDVRILAATNHDLDALVESGRFRMDLYYRLNTVTLFPPPLRERREDIPALVAHFLARAEGRPLSMSAEALERLRGYAFPGNVRELERIVERGRILCDGAVVELRHLPELGQSHALPRGPRPVAAPGDTVEPAEQSGTRTPEAMAAELYDRVVTGGESFDDVVHTPFLRRTLAGGVVRILIERCYLEAGRSNRQMARMFHLDDVKQYRRLTAFLRNHKLLVRKHG